MSQKSLRDTEWQVRFAAVTALKGFKDGAAKAAIQSLKDDPHEKVSGLVAWVLTA